MSSLFRSIGSRLQTSSTARLVLYGTAATATSVVTWNYHAQSRREREKQVLERKKVAAVHPGIEQSPRPSPMRDIQHKPSHTGDRNAHIPEAAKTPIEVPVDAEKQHQEQDQEQTEATEATNTGAFDPETGEINWDCPCLGGMAHGPCGPQFRAAFSCFVYSEAEPKGVDCVEKFREMQDCFRAHPDVYAEELRDDDEPIDDDINDSSNSAPSGPSSTAGGEGLEPPSVNAPKPPAKPPAGQDKLPHPPPPLPPSEPIKGPPALPPNPLPKPPTTIDPPAPAGPITSLPGATRTGSESS